MHHQERQQCAMENLLWDAVSQEPVQFAVFVRSHHNHDGDAGVFSEFNILGSIDDGADDILAGGYSWIDGDARREGRVGVQPLNDLFQIALRLLKSLLSRRVISVGLW